MNSRRDHAAGSRKDWRPQAILDEAEAATAKLPKVSGAAQQYISPRLNAIFSQAKKEADRLKDEYVSTEHLLLAIAEEKGGEAGRILRSHGVDRESLRKVIEQMRGGTRITNQNAEESYQALSKYSRDLTELARQGKLDPVIGAITSGRSAMSCPADQDIRSHRRACSANRDR